MRPDTASRRRLVQTVEGEMRAAEIAAVDWVMVFTNFLTRTVTRTRVLEASSPRAAIGRLASGTRAPGSSLRH